MGNPASTTNASPKQNNAHLKRNLNNAVAFLLKDPWGDGARWIAAGNYANKPAARTFRPALWQ